MPLLGEPSDRDLQIFELTYQPTLPDELHRLQMTRVWSRALVVHSHQPAHAIADIAKLNDIDLIVTVDEKDKVNGVLAAKELVSYARSIQGAAVGQ